MEKYNRIKDYLASEFDAHLGEGELEVLVAH